MPPQTQQFKQNEKAEKCSAGLLYMGQSNTRMWTLVKGIITGRLLAGGWNSQLLGVMGPCQLHSRKKKKKGFEPYSDSWRVRPGGEGMLGLYSNVSRIFMRPMQLHRPHTQKNLLLGLMLCYYCSAGEGNGNSLQYSCLENSMDRGAWWAVVHGVEKSQTRLSD